MSQQNYPIKMYTSIIPDVLLYKDISFTNHWDGINDKFDLEIIGDKARVICKGFFVDKNKNTSRLNKLKYVSSSDGFYHYKLICNGKKTFIKIKHDITK